MSIITLTWVSGSWKTTLQNALIEKHWFKKFINWTTRNPRDKKVYETNANWDFTSDELQEYVFITKKQFEQKIRNWDFIEFTNSYWNYYWMTKPKEDIDFNDNYCLILDPTWLSQFIRYFKLHWIPFTTLFLDISEDLQEERLWFQRRESIKVIEERKKDFLYFKDFKYDVILDGSKPIQDNVDIVLDIINNS